MIRSSMMNIETRIDRVQGLRSHVLRGAGRFSDIKSYLEGLFLAAEFDPTIPAVWDVREAVFSDVTPSEVRDLACFLHQHWTAKYQRKMAVVASADFHFGLSRMLEQFTGPSAQGKFRTFRDLPPALEWIGGQATAAPHPAQE